MTTTEIWLFDGLYLAVLIDVVILTRATARRVAGALAGGVALGVVALGIVALGEQMGLWHMVITWTPDFLLFLMIGFALCAYILLITWRIARRFGARGLVAVLVVAAIIGPPRDYWYMRHFPHWGHYAPGVAPVLAISAAYIVGILAGHGVMRWVAGPASEDRLARRPWETG